MKKRMKRIALTITMAVTMLLSGTVGTFASAPLIEDIEFKNSGRVEVDFRGKVQYNKMKVTVKDTSGKKYTVKSIRKDNDEVDFTISNFKKGKTYKITVQGIRKRGTKAYGKVTGTLKVPAPATGATISKTTALNKAKSHAQKSWKASKLWDVEVESDKYRGQAVWEVSFNGKIGGKPYEFEYKIAKKGGKVLFQKKEYDD